MGWVTFIFGYAFILNVIGILLGSLAGVMISIIFFVSSWVLMGIYSVVDVSYEKSVVRERVIKDALFILIQLFLGVFVVLDFIRGGSFLLWFKKDCQLPGVTGFLVQKIGKS